MTGILASTPMMLVGDTGTDSATMTIGSYYAAPVTYYGYSDGTYNPAGHSFGSLSLTLQDGKVVKSFISAFYTTYTSTLYISGFSSDPGQSYLYSVTSNGTTKTGAAASTYTYSGGVAYWTWTVFNIGTTGTTTVTVRRF